MKRKNVLMLLWERDKRAANLAEERLRALDLALAVQDKAVAAALERTKTLIAGIGVMLAIAGAIFEMLRGGVR